jgi:hypothetical protein
MRKLDFISASTAITGYSDSQLAKSETKDCAVRTIASAYGITYDKAHTWVREKFNRQNRKGTFGFIVGLDTMSNTGEKLNRKGIKKLDITIMSKTGLRIMTVNNFSQNYSKGNYIITVKGHTFTLKDGKVIGNFEDARKLRKKITGAWKIGK